MQERSKEETAEQSLVSDDKRMASGISEGRIPMRAARIFNYLLAVWGQFMFSIVKFVFKTIQGTEI